MRKTALRRFYDVDVYDVTSAHIQAVLSDGSGAKGVCEGDVWMTVR
jgi:hypothetical protein